MWEYVKGSEADFVGAPEWATECVWSDKRSDHFVYWLDKSTCRIQSPFFSETKFNGSYGRRNFVKAERRKVDNLQSRVNDANLGDALKEMFRDVPGAEIRIGSGVAPGEHSGPVYDLSQSAPVENKYNRQCKGVTIDVYDVLLAFNVTNPALQHLVKKALCTGLRGHKDRSEDLQDILDSAKRAVELESDK